MSWSLPSDIVAFIAVAGAAVVAIMAWRDHRAQQNQRRSLLDDCAHVLDDCAISYGGDRFPRLDGVWGGQPVHAELVPDSMTIRRLPQLWLSLTALKSRRGLAEFGVLVRPAGTEFYALTPTFDSRLEPLAGMPAEIVVRGRGRDAQRLLTSLQAVVVRILSDPRVKEIAVTARGVRLVWQTGEGRRGEHLLLRQLTFDDAGLRPADFLKLLASLKQIDEAIDAHVAASQSEASADAPKLLEMAGHER